MRLDRLPAKIGSKLYSDRILIDIFDPNLPVRSIVATISIRFQVDNWSKSIDNDRCNGKYIENVIF